MWVFHFNKVPVKVQISCNKLIIITTRPPAWVSHSQDGKQEIYFEWPNGLNTRLILTCRTALKKHVLPRLVSPWVGLKQSVNKSCPRRYTSRLKNIYTVQHTGTGSEWPPGIFFGILSTLVSGPLGAFWPPFWLCCLPLPTTPLPFLLPMIR